VLFKLNVWILDMGIALGYEADRLDTEIIEKEVETNFPGCFSNVFNDGMKIIYA